MKKYTELTKEEAQELYSSVMEEYNSHKKAGIKLDLSRGKPNSDQLDISQGLMNVCLSREECFSADGTDCRNYGVLEGLPEMRRFFADVFGLNYEDIIVGGNSSLQLMYDTLTRGMLYGTQTSPRPWCLEQNRKWICVTPGYDRHFRITQTLGFKLLSVPMTDEGPDMDMVEELVKDPDVKGIWCVPKYSNPTGNTYSENTVRRLLSMKCAAPDFRIMWDNAYGVHDIEENGDELVNVFDIAKEYSNEDRVLYFSSTSKITFPGGGVAMMAASEGNRRRIFPNLGAQTIGYDKLNQLRHLKFFGTPDNLMLHMKKQGKMIKEKFDTVLSEFESLKGLGIAKWTEPKGGYFISVDCMPGTAKRVYELMKDAGVTLTPAGATFPYGVDPEDKNLRIAPTYPSVSELSLATKILVLAIKLASLELLMKN